MLDFKLLPGDKYDGRCAEIYITEKQFLVYHCSVCEEIYATFNELLSHITNDHYQNTKEYSDVEDKSVENVVTQRNDKENQLVTKELVAISKSFNKYPEGNQRIEKTRHKDKCEQTYKEYVLETLAEINELKYAIEAVDAPQLFKSSKTQRKKLKVVTTTLKSPAIGKTKINSLTRYQVISNEERKYVCSICGFAFKEKYNLRGHLLRHSNKKTVSCSVCPKKFFNKVEIRLNECRHKEERPHVCTDCGMGFISSSSLTQHTRKHHIPRRSFKCEQCYMAFANFCQPHEHNSKESKFECPMNFKSETSIKSHLKLDENSYKFRCENCDLELNNAVAVK